MPTRTFLAGILMTLLVFAGCERTQPRAAARHDTAAEPVDSSATTDSVVQAPVRLSWDDIDPASVLIVRPTQSDGQAQSDAEAAIAFPRPAEASLPDTVVFSHNPIAADVIDLFGHSGRVGEARVGRMEVTRWADPECRRWPGVTLVPVAENPAGASSTEGSVDRQWTIALLAGRADGVPLDSIEGAASADSAHLAAEIARLASALPYDTASAFRGIPFTVRSAYRFAVVPGTQELVADVVRTVNQEASPLEQHTLIIAERTPGVGSARFHTVHFERTADAEDAVETSEVLAAVRFRTPTHVALVLRTMGDDDESYRILERTESGAWKAVWVSPPTGC